MSNVVMKVKGADTEFIHVSTPTNNTGAFSVSDDTGTPVINADTVSGEVTIPRLKNGLLGLHNYMQIQGGL